MFQKILRGNLLTLTSVCRRIYTGWGVWRQTWLPPGWTWHTGSCPPCPSWEGLGNGPHLRNMNILLNSTYMTKTFLFSCFFFFYCLLEKKQGKRKKLKALLYSLCVIQASFRLLSTSSGCNLVAKLSKQKGITRCVFLLGTAKYIFVKSCFRAGNCQLFEVLFRCIHGKNQFQVPLSLQKKEKKNEKKKNCHLRPIRKPLISCTFHVQVSFG